MQDSCSQWTRWQEDTPGCPAAEMGLALDSAGLAGSVGDLIHPYLAECFRQVSSLHEIKARSVGTLLGCNIYF